MDEAAHVAKRARDVALALEVLGEDEISRPADEALAVARLELEDARGEEDQLAPRRVVVVLLVTLRRLAEENRFAGKGFRRGPRVAGHRDSAHLDRRASRFRGEYPDDAHASRRPMSGDATAVPVVLRLALAAGAGVIECPSKGGSSRMRRPTIRVHLLVLALAAIVPVAGAVIYVIVDASRTSLEQAENEVGNLAATTASEVAARLAENEELLSRLARRPLVKAMNPRRCDPFADEFARLHPDYINLTVRDVHGNRVCSLLPVPPANVVARFPWFQEVIRGDRLVAGDAVRDVATGIWFSALLYPVHDDGGVVIGVLVISIDLMKLQGRVMPTLPKDVVVSVIDRRGKFLMRSENPDLWIGTGVRNPETVNEARNHAAGSYRVESVDGIHRYFAYRTIAGAGWLVSAGIPEDRLYAPLTRRLWIAAAVVAATLLVALLLVRRIAAAIAKPVRDLEATAVRVSAGDLQARAPIGGPAEIANVASEFNRMVEIRSATEAHIKNLNRIHTVLSRINALIVRVREREELFREACRIAVEAGQFRMAWIGAVDHRTETVKPVAWDGDVRDFFEVAPLAVTETRPGGHGLAGRAVRETKPAVSNDVASDPQR